MNEVGNERGRSRESNSALIIEMRPLVVELLNIEGRCYQERTSTGEAKNHENRDSY
jgi:hypothetical protein